MVVLRAYYFAGGDRLKYMIKRRMRNIIHPLHKITMQVWWTCVSNSITRHRSKSWRFKGSIPKKYHVFVCICHANSYVLHMCWWNVKMPRLQGPKDMDQTSLRDHQIFQSVMLRAWPHCRAPEICRILPCWSNHLGHHHSHTGNWTSAIHNCAWIQSWKSLGNASGINVQWYR